MHNYMQVTLNQILIITPPYMYLINITQYLNVYLHCNKDSLK